jgi:hypothetical protein
MSRCHVNTPSGKLASRSFTRKTVFVSVMAQSLLGGGLNRCLYQPVAGTKASANDAKISCRHFERSEAILRRLDCRVATLFAMTAPGQKRSSSHPCP